MFVIESFVLLVLIKFSLLAELVKKLVLKLIPVEIRFLLLFKLLISRLWLLQFDKRLLSVANLVFNQFSYFIQLRIE